MENLKEWQVEILDPNSDSECWDNEAVPENIRAKNPEEALEIAKDYLDECAAKYGEYNSDVPYSSTLKYRIHEIFTDGEGDYCESECFYF